VPLIRLRYDIATHLLYTYKELGYQNCDSYFSKVELGLYFQTCRFLYTKLWGCKREWRRRARNTSVKNAELLWLLKTHVAVLHATWYVAAFQ